MVTKETDTKAASKSRRWVVGFSSGQPWFAWRQATRDDDKRKLTPRRLQKVGAGLPFYKAGPDLPGDRQPGDDDKRNCHVIKPPRGEIPKKRTAEAKSDFPAESEVPGWCSRALSSWEIKI